MDTPRCSQRPYSSFSYLSPANSLKSPVTLLYRSLCRWFFSAVVRCSTFVLCCTRIPNRPTATLRRRIYTLKIRHIVRHVKIDDIDIFIISFVMKNIHFKNIYAQKTKLVTCRLCKDSGMVGSFAKNKRLQVCIPTYDNTVLLHKRHLFDILLVSRKLLCVA